jgi:hypothetical protein
MPRNKIWAKTILEPPPLEDQVAMTDYPWDDNASMMDKLDNAVIGTLMDYDHIDSGASNNRAGTYSKSANDAALRFAIHFITQQYHEINLLQSLSYAKASNHLYKEIIE